MNLNKLQESIETFINDTYPIFKGPNEYKDLYYGPVVESTFRRDYLMLKTILLLSERPISEHIIYSGSCMDLSRKAFEDLINLEFMELKGKTKQSKKFKLFKKVEIMRDLVFLEEMGRKQSESTTKYVKEEFEKVKNEFKDVKNKDGVRNGPFIGIEAMIDELLRTSKLDKSGYLTIGQIYILGCRSNHFSPTDIYHHQRQEVLESTTKDYISMSLLFTFTSLVNITIKLTNELENVDKRLVKRIINTWEIIKNADKTNIFEYDPIMEK